MDERTLISATELRAHLDDPSLVVFDCRYDLADRDAGSRAYAAGHVPGARFADLNADLAAPPSGTNGRHPLPAPDAFSGWLARNGVEAGSQVVAYDQSGGFAAARLWWMLRHWWGHERAAVLDGGWDAWVASGGPVAREAPVVAPVVAPARPGGGPREVTVDAAFVESRLGEATPLVLDARASERFRGEVEPLDPVAGHIPGARNRPYLQNLAAGGAFKSPQVLRGEFEALLEGVRPDQVVHQCGSGVSACHNLLAMEIAGLSGSRLYPGSWSEWCADPRRPVQRG